MEKKNPFITTVGFKKDDPDHVYVAELLNSLGRGKASYIVKAVLAYQEVQKQGGITQSVGTLFDYEGIKRIVLQVLEERDKQTAYIEPVPVKQEKPKEPERAENNILDDFNDNDLNDIMAALAAFQEQ